MKDKNSQMDPGWSNNGSSQHTSNIKELQDENERLRTLISKITQSMTWGNSVIKVVFRDEFFEEKYRSKIENFLKEILDPDENFILNSQVYDNAEQEFRKNQDSFQAEKLNKQHQNAVNSQSNIPIYSYDFEDVLHCDEPEFEEQIDLDKPPTMTCFNCLGDHHMNKCPEKIDRLRIAANKKEILTDNSSRYHEEEKRHSKKPGILSCEMRLALGLRNDQLPKHIYHMRVIDYPPGWMDDALFETSGLSLYDGKPTMGDEPEESTEIGNKYDSSKFVEYPGFNCPMPPDCIDDWKDMGLPPIQPRQQLAETIKANNTINDANMCKRKNSTSTDDEEPKKIRNGTNETLSDWSPENCSTPKKTECPFPNAHNDTPIETSLGISLSQSPGTPILKQGNPFCKLPAADKFAQGITEHLPFENLPESVGKFDKIRGLLSDVQKKLQTIKNS